MGWTTDSTGRICSARAAECGCGKIYCKLFSKRTCYCSLSCGTVRSADMSTHVLKGQINTTAFVERLWIRTFPCYTHKSLQVENPKPDHWSIAHSCDEACERQLQCKHNCRLLCHPGPCPACPVVGNFHQLTRSRFSCLQIVQASCHCGSAPKRAVRCAQRAWSCQQLCNRLLLCGVHRCADVCHAGECKPCVSTSEQSCR